MNSLERVNAILNHKEADHVPVYPLINSISWKYTGITYKEWTLDPKKCAESIIKATDELDLDVVCTLVDLSVEAADWGMEVNYFDNMAAMPSENKLLKTAEDYKKIEVLNPRETERMSKMIELTKLLSDNYKGEKPVVAFVFGPMGILSMMRGMEALMLDCYKKPAKEYMVEAMEKVTDTLIEYCDALIEAGADAIMFDTLFSSKTIMRASMWDKYEGLFVQKLAEHVHAKGKGVMIHNCGDGIYLKEQIERMHPEAISLLYLSPDSNSMAEMKELYGSQTTFIGHIDPGYLMVADEEGLRKQCREMIDAYKKDGGFILATGCEYPALLDDKWAKIMVEEAKNYGKY